MVLYVTVRQENSTQHHVKIDRKALIWTGCGVPYIINVTNLVTVGGDVPTCLEALAVDDSRAGLVVFLFGDPHLLEGGEGSQDGSADPYGVLPFWGSDDLDLDGRWGESGDFFLHTIGDT